VQETSGERLIEHGFHALGWWSILRHAQLLEALDEPTPRARTDYFALCLAVHCASVASYVPDRRRRQDPPRAVVSSPCPRRSSSACARWRSTTAPGRCAASARASPRVEGAGPVSGHDGERLSVLCGAMMGMLAAGRAADAAVFEEAVDAELAREARAFETLARARGREVELLNPLQRADAQHRRRDAGHRAQGHEGHRRGRRSCASGSSRASASSATAAPSARPRRSTGELLASEGHRHYPLREQKLLRASHELLLPLGPFMDAWGEKLARWPKWGAKERAAVVGSLLDGCRKVPGQEAYYRALAGFDRAAPGGLESRELDAHFGSAARRELKDANLRKKLAVRRESFESSYGKRARALLESWR